MTWLTQSFQSNTLAWLVLSALLGGILGASVRFLHEDLLRPWLGLRRETKRVIRQFEAPLVRSAETLERRINILVRNHEQNWFVKDEYFRLSTLYGFGEHLGWVRIIERQFGFLPFESSRRGGVFNKRLNGIFRALTSHTYFRSQPDQDAVAESVLPRLMLSAIGEVMIDRGEQQSPAVVPAAWPTKEPTPRVIEFTEFARRYVNDLQLQRWFAEASQLFASADPKHPLCWDRVIAAGANLRALIWFLDPKAHMVLGRPLANLDVLCSPVVRAMLEEELPARVPAAKPRQSMGRLVEAPARKRTPPAPPAPSDSH